MSLHRQPSNEDIYPSPIMRRIVIDPEKLIKLKKQRQPFKMVPSRFEPEQSEPVLPTYTDVQPPPIHTSSDSSYQLNSNISVVSSLVSIEFNQLFRFEEAEDLPLEDTDAVWVTITGEIKFLLTNRKWFHAREGFMFFLSEAMRKHFVEATTEKSTVLLKLPRSSFLSLILPYFNARNEEVIRWLSQSPYLIRWPRELVEDVATMFEVQQYERGSTLYQREDEPQYVYLLKEGVALLERSVPLTSQHRSAFEQYELQHEMNSHNESDNSLIVRKSMLFGLDGVLLKQGRGRLYHCKTMSACEVYAIRCELFEVLAEQQPDMLVEDHFIKQYTLRQVGSSTNSVALASVLPTPNRAIVQRNSLQHSSVLIERKLRNRSPPEDSRRSVKPISLSLRISRSVDLVKKANVENIIRHEQKVRKMSIMSPARSRVNKSCLDVKAVECNPFDVGHKPNHQRYDSSERQLPVLAIRNPVEKHIYKALERQNEVMRTVDFLSFKERISQRLDSRKDSKTSFCFNIKNYRSIVSGSRPFRNMSKSRTANPESPSKPTP